jgi:hypothetical protein
VTAVSILKLDGGDDCVTPQMYSKLLSHTLGKSKLIILYFILHYYNL